MARSAGVVRSSDSTTRIGFLYGGVDVAISKLVAIPSEAVYVALAQVLHFVAAKNEAVFYQAVSYTHLDVYKRQAQHTRIGG